MNSSANNDESTPKSSTYHNPRGVVVVSHEARDLGIPVIARSSKPNKTNPWSSERRRGGGRGGGMIQSYRSTPLYCADVPDPAGGKHTLGSTTYATYRPTDSLYTLQLTHGNVSCSAVDRELYK
jgi:hypothetical protein